MTGRSGKERPGSRIATQRTGGDTLRRPQGVESEASHDERMPGDPDGAQDVAYHLFPSIDHGTDQAAVGRPGVAECGCGIVHSPLKHRRRSVVERMGKGRGGVHPLQPMFGQRQGAEEWRCRSQRIDTGEGVVNEAGQRQLLAPRRATNNVVGLEEQDGSPSLCHPYGGGQSVRPRANDHRVITAGFASAHLRRGGGNCGRHSVDGSTSFMDAPGSG